jgi:short-subunit dehydrogenase
MNNNRRAIVMGATSGIGMELALLLAQKGWKVGIAGRREDRLADIMSRTEGIAVKKRIDITADNATEQFSEMIDELGGIDLYVHSSGIGWQNIDLDNEKELNTVNTNVIGFTRMVSMIFNFMAQNGGGHIVCITSIAGTKGLGAAPAYSATKRYQSHYLECLSQMAKMRRLDIDITDIRPGFVDTDLVRGTDYPLKLSAAKVAKEILYAIENKKEIRTIDWRYRLLVTLWHIIPRWLWIRINIK